MKPVVAQLKSQNKIKLAEDLFNQIQKSKSVIKQFGFGQVIFGQVVIGDGKKSPMIIHAQMPIIEDGYFVGVVRDLTGPIGFRLEGYKPVDLELKNKSVTQVVNAGQIILRPLAEKERARISGTVRLADMWQ